MGDKTEQRFSTGVALHPRGHLALSEDYFGRHNWEWGGWGGDAIGSEQRPRMLPNIPQ